MKPTLGATALALIVAALAGCLIQHAPAPAVIAFTGDVMLGRDVERARSESGWEGALSALGPVLLTADAAFANLESPLSRGAQITSGYDLRAPPESVRALSRAHFSVLSLANNHALDAGEIGLRESISALQRAGIQALYMGSEPWRLQLGRTTSAWFALDDTVEPLNLEVVSSAIRAQAASDLVVVSVHWGRELEPAPTARQRALAMSLASSGVDVIVGHHPHVLQPVEVVWGIGRGRPTLVAYSLGNALFDQVSPPNTQRGALLVIELGPAGWSRPCALPFRILPAEGRVVWPGETEATTILKQLELTCSLGSPELRLHSPATRAFQAEGAP